jgi:hypothetical protein
VNMAWGILVVPLDTGASAVLLGGGTDSPIESRATGKRTGDGLILLAFCDLLESRTFVHR